MAKSARRCILLQNLQTPYSGSNMLDSFPAVLWDAAYAVVI
jgi:hypothetical protein